jgi:chloramphenicol 3-O-phosphotransferase
VSAAGTVPGASDDAAMSPRVLILNGPPAVGKTSVARLMHGRVAGAVCVHGDDLRAFVPDAAAAHLGGGSTYRAAAALVREYVAMGARALVFDYCFLNARHVEHFRDALGDGIETTLVTLWAPLDVVRARDARRASLPGAAREALGEKVDECRRSMDANRADLGEFHDVGTQSPDALAAKLAARMGWPYRRAAERL